MAKKLAKTYPEVLQYEEQEPRLLFSADLAPGVESAVVIDITAELESQKGTVAEPEVQVSEQQRTEIVFINDNVTNYQQLLAELDASDPDRQLDVYTLSSTEDGLSQIESILANYSDLDAIHILSHGSDGSVNLGSNWLDGTSLEQNNASVADWGDALNENGDILIYGCNLTATEAGEQLIAEIATLTGADVAASQDPTGHSDLGGDWELESHIGNIEADNIVSSSGQAEWQGLLANFNDLDATQTYVAGGPAIVIDGDVTLTTSASTFNGTTLTLTSTAATPGNDVYSNSGNLGGLGVGANLTLDGGTTTLGVVTQNGNGVLILDFNGSATLADVNEIMQSITYRHTATEDISVTIDWQFDGDGGGDSTWATGSITVTTTTNTPPVATDDSFTLNEGATATLDLAANDTDADDGLDLTSISIVSGPSNGSIVVNADGTVDYTHDGSETLSDSFTYTIADLSGAVSNTATVSLTITAVDDASLDLFSDPSSLSVDENAADGTVVGTITAGIYYNPDNGNYYQLVDASISWNEALTIAAASTLNGQSGQLVTISDLNENNLVESLSALAQTNVWIGASDELVEGEWRWYDGTAPSDLFWQGDFTGSSVGGLYENWFIANEQPGGVGDHYAILRNGAGVWPGFWADRDAATTNPYIIEYSGVGAYPISYAIQSQSANGAFAIDAISGELTVADGTLLDYESSSSQTVTVRVTTPEGTYDEIFTINLNDINEAPTDVALANTVSSLPEDTDTTSAIKIADIVITDDALGTNDLSLTGADAADFEIVGSELYLQAGTTLDYETKTTYDVTVQVDDTSVGATPDDSVAFTLSVTDINETPTTTGIANVTVNEDAADTVIDLFAAFADTEDADADLTYTVESNSNAGLFNAVTVDGTTGTLTLDYAANQNGTATFTIRATDSGGLWVEDIFTVNVLPVTDLTATNDSFTTDEDVALSDSVATNDATTSGGVLSYTLGTDVSNGTLTLNADGSFDYTPDADYHGSDSFTYTVSDAASGESLTHTVSITVNSINDAPVANDDSLTTNEDTDQTFNAAGVLLLNDSDVDGDSLTITGFTQPSNGSVVNNGDGTWTYTPDSNFNGSDSFDYTVSDGNGGTATATVNITVNAVNDTPSATDDSYSTAEDTALNAATVLANDSDPDSGDTLTVNTTPVADVSYGTLILAANGTFTYTPDANFNGTDQFTYQVEDGNGGSGTATVTITVTPVNDAPVANDDSASVIQGSSVVINLIANDSDVDDSLDLSSILVTSAPGNGSLVDNGDGTLTYTHDGSATLSDSFSYSIDDASGATSNTATVSITVNPASAPVAVADSLTTSEDTDLTITTATDLLANDSDSDSAFSIDSFTQPSNGTLTDEGGGTWTYTPAADFNDSDSFTYTITDGISSATTTVTITVTPVNDAPVANNDSVSTDEDTTVNGNVLGNDSDIDGDSLTVNTTPVSDVSNGSLTLNGDGSFSYTPDANFNGSDSFDYEISDGNGGTAQATVTITVNPVNDAPIFTSTPVTSATQGVPYSYTITTSDVDGDPLTITSPGLPPGAFLTDNGDGTATLSGIPTNSDVGDHSLTIQVSDGSLTTTQYFTVTVTNVNDAPVAVDDAITVDEDTPFSSTISLVANDTDIDGDSLTAVAGTFATSQGGTLQLASDGSYTYTPASNFNGTDTVDYTVTDGSLTDTGTLTITVTPVDDLPLAVADSITVSEDGVYNGDVSGNDTPSGDGGNSYSVQPGDGPAHGTVSMNGDGTFSYTPDADYYGADSFTYTLTDVDGDTSTALVSVTVTPVDDLPVAVADSITATEDVTYNGDVSGNDTPSADGGNSYSVQPGDEPAHGSVSMNADGTFSYTPDVNYYGADSFTYTLTDADGDTSTALVSVTVNPVNDAPLANNDSFTGNEDTAITGNVLGNDSDPESDPLSASVLTGPANGSLTLNPDGTFSYTPGANFNGSDSFTYTVSDGNGGTASATVNITVNPVNDVPTAVNDSFSGTEDTTLTGNVLSNDSDPDSDPLTVALTSGPSNGSLTLNPDGSFSYAPNLNFNGSDSFIYSISDGNGATANATVTLTVLPVNHAPTGQPAIVGDAQEGALLQANTSSISDADGLGTFSYQWLRDGTPITGATTANYQLQNSDVGSQISVQVDYTDGGGNAESLTSVQLGPIAALPDTGTPTEPEPDPEPDPDPDPGGGLPPTGTDPDDGDAGDEGEASDEIAKEDAPAEKEDSGADEDQGSTDSAGSSYYEDESLQPESRRKSSFRYFDNDLYKQLLEPPNSTQLAGFVEQDNILPELDFEESANVTASADLDQFRQQVDQDFDKQRDLEIARTRAVTFVSTVFSIGIVSYLLRAGSLVASLTSTLPLWRGFDPIAVLTKKTKQKKLKRKSKIPDSMFEGDDR